MKRIFLLDIFVFICFLSGCFPRKAKQVPSVLQKNNAWETLEAKWYDIPIPFQAQRSSLAEIEQGGYHLRYSIKNSSLKELYPWFTVEMGRHGWHEYLGYVSLGQAVLVFEKPTKRCVITLTQELRTLTVSFFYHELTTQEIAEFIE